MLQPPWAGLIYLAAYALGCLTGAASMYSLMRRCPVRRLMLTLERGLRDGSVTLRPPDPPKD